MKHKVLIMKCDRYDPEKIAGLIGEGIEELGVKPRGKVLVKPNCVVAHPDFFAHAFTRKEFLEGVIVALKEKGEAIEELALGENSGIKIPTRYCFKNAGYLDVLKRHNVKVHYFDEAQQVPVKLGRKESLRQQILVPRPIIECDFFINLPKFKANPWTRLTLGLKNYMGIQADGPRLMDHNAFLEHKIADLQDVLQPGLVAVDAIIAGQEMVLSPTPFAMGAIVMGTNCCAVDVVCCAMVHVEPGSVDHLRIASERGFGPIDLDDIEVDGDYPLNEIRRKTTDFSLLRERIDDSFKDHNKLTCTVGTFPYEHSRDYCWGGCPGLLQEAMHLHRLHSLHKVDEMTRLRYVVGRVDAPLELAEDERVIFAGDCCRWEGRINGKLVKIQGDRESSRKTMTSEMRSTDTIAKAVSSVLHCLTTAPSGYIHLKGCPVSGVELGVYLSLFGGLPIIPLDTRTILSIIGSYAQTRMGRLYKRFRD
jgi:uncharacterized protein (DUF362 family)